MKIFIIAILFLVIGVLIGIFLPKNQINSSGSSAEYQAFLERDNLGMQGSFSDFQQTRWQNHLKYQEGMFPVDTVVKVEVEKTQDTNNYVIQMTNVDGQIASLWLTGDNVSGLTNY